MDGYSELGSQVHRGTSVIKSGPSKGSINSHVVEWGSLQGRSQDFSKGRAEVMEAKALKRKSCF